MSKIRPWHHYQEWHELLDAICVDQGHLDDMELASALSAASGNGKSAAYEAALKNLRNWRAGAHVPRRRNFLLLTKVLRVDSYEGLRDHWIGLYGRSSAKARADGTTTPADAGASALAAAGHAVSEIGRRRATTWLFASIVPLAVVAAGSAYLLTGGLEISAKDMPAAEVEYRPSTTVGVGESAVVHGARGVCGKAPPEWDSVVQGLPELDIGTWSDGGVGVRYSRRCNGFTPARGVVFTAVRPGEAVFTLFGDPVAIRVK
ncbi:hypothetical protein N1F89_18575 [Aquibium sp. A9E412]|uniref:hypothetical protein n=1 Tax=Aquibium sp. A9E412 TaxID=2976767 RepID=UPI0025B053A5|nr:hypothetical protein [Aquibium sp. A9E412]MDN2568233.1 hypothetical protein [Aquibium sp. A9E412]